MGLKGFRRACNKLDIVYFDSSDYWVSNLFIRKDV